ncbi:hypothetical protein IJT17_07695 [bacterium]|nr:hypothetical protein [bacterium]
MSLKKLGIFALLASTLMTGTAWAHNSKISDNGYYLPKGIKLQGKVKIVQSNADIKIKAVTSFPDIKVKAVSSFPDAIGKWQFVDSFPDFTVQYVESFEDIKVQFVDSFPGVVK